MNYILFGAQARDHMLPFTFIRPLADIRVGILTIRQKWEAWLQQETSTLTMPYLSEKYPLVKESDNILINSSVLPDEVLLAEIDRLQPNQTLVSGDVLIAHRVKEEDIGNMAQELLDHVEPLHTRCNIRKLSRLWDIVTLNESEIAVDHKMITKGREGQPLPAHARALAPENIFIEAGAKIDMAMINASEGPVYIGEGAHVMDGAMIKGPAGIGSGATVRMGAKIYGGSSVGPQSKVGGEMHSSVIFGYSNKAHEGFLGHSVIGEWCNIGADTNTSNLKINYDKIRLWDYVEQSFIRSDRTFCGTFMGDHSKCGIDTMFNTGTVIGVGAQVFGTGYMRNFIPSFARGSGFDVVAIDKAIEVAKRVYARRNMTFSAMDEKILRHVFDETASFRKDR